MAKGVNKTATGKVVYIGPFYPFGTKLDAYDRRGLTPREWTDEERTYWIGVEPRLGEWFSTEDEGNAADASNE